jgi:hypothetical protein
MDQSILTNWFYYHPPTPDQSPKYTAIRAAALSFATVINDNCPDGPDKIAAMRLIRDAVATANGSIACWVEDGEEVIIRPRTAVPVIDDLDDDPYF